MQNNNAQQAAREQLIITCHDVIMEGNAWHHQGQQTSRESVLRDIEEYFQTHASKIQNGECVPLIAINSHGDGKSLRMANDSRLGAQELMDYIGKCRSKFNLREKPCTLYLSACMAGLNTGYIESAGPNFNFLYHSNDLTPGDMFKPMQGEPKSLIELIQAFVVAGMPCHLAMTNENGKAEKPITASFSREDLLNLASQQNEIDTKQAIEVAVQERLECVVKAIPQKALHLQGYEDSEKALSLVTKCKFKTNVDAARFLANTFYTLTRERAHFSSADMTKLNHLTYPLIGLSMDDVAKIPMKTLNGKKAAQYVNDRANYRKKVTDDILGPAKALITDKVQFNQLEDAVKQASLSRLALSSMRIRGTLKEQPGQWLQVLENGEGLMLEQGKERIFEQFLPADWEMLNKILDKLSPAQIQVCAGIAGMLSPQYYEVLIQNAPNLDVAHTKIFVESPASSLPLAHYKMLVTECGKLKLNEDQIKALASYGAKNLPPDLYQKLIQNANKLQKDRIGAIITGSTHTLPEHCKVLIENAPNLDVAHTKIFVESPALLLPLAHYKMLVTECGKLKLNVEQIKVLTSYSAGHVPLDLYQELIENAPNLDVAHTKIFADCPALLLPLAHYKMLVTECGKLKLNVDQIEALAYGGAKNLPLDLYQELIQNPKSLKPDQIKAIITEHINTLPEHCKALIENAPNLDVAHTKIFATYPATLLPLERYKMLVTECGELNKEQLETVAWNGINSSLVDYKQMIGDSKNKKQGMLQGQRSWQQKKEDAEASKQGPSGPSIP